MRKNNTIRTILIILSCLIGAIGLFMIGFYFSDKSNKEWESKNTNQIVNVISTEDSYYTTHPQYEYQEVLNFSESDIYKTKVYLIGTVADVRKISDTEYYFVLNMINTQDPYNSNKNWIQCTIPIEPDVATGDFVEVFGVYTGKQYLNSIQVPQILVEQTKIVK